MPRKTNWTVGVPNQTRAWHTMKAWCLWPPTSYLTLPTAISAGDCPSLYCLVNSGPNLTRIHTSRTGVTLSLVPITMHLPPGLQFSQSATQCMIMMTPKCSSACNTPYDLRCVASYQPPPSYFYPTGKTRASIPTEHWCEITQNTAPRLASSPRQNSHMQCQPCGRVYNVISQFLQPHLEHGYYCCLEQRSTIAFNWCLTELAANTAKEYPRSSLGKISTSQERTLTTSPTMFAPSTSN